MLLGGTLLLFWAGIYYVSLQPEEGKVGRLEDVKKRCVASHISYVDNRNNR